MPKPAGSQKSGGRKKGTPNKRTLAFADALAERGINLLDEILNAAEKLPRPEKMAAYMQLLPYLYPKRKPTDTPASIDEQLNTLSTDQIRAVRDNLNARLKDTNQTVPPEERQRCRNNLMRLIQLREELGDPSDGSVL